MTGYIVNVLIVHKNKVLLLQRSPKDKYKPLAWGFVAGNVNKNESMEKSALREAFEEAGVRLKKIVPIGSSVYRGSKEICVRVTYLAKVSSFKIKLSHEHSNFEWRDIDERFEPKIQEQVNLARKLL